MQVITLSSCIAILDLIWGTSLLLIVTVRGLATVSSFFHAFFSSFVSFEHIITQCLHCNTHLIFRYFITFYTYSYNCRTICKMIEGISHLKVACNAVVRHSSRNGTEQSVFYLQTALHRDDHNCGRIHKKEERRDKDSSHFGQWWIVRIAFRFRLVKIYVCLSTTDSIPLRKICFEIKCINWS